MAAADAAGWDLALDAAPLFSVPGREPEWPWRAPGGVDRASEGAAARRLYPPSPLHEAARRGDVAAVQAALDAGADVDALDEARPSRGGGDRTESLTPRGYTGRPHVAPLRGRL